MTLGPVPRTAIFQALRKVLGSWVSCCRHGAHFTHFFYLPDPCQWQVGGPSECSGLPENVPFPIPLHIHLLAPARSRSLSLLCPQRLGDAFFSQLSLRCGVLRRPGSATVIKAQENGKLQISGVAGFRTGPRCPRRGGYACGFHKTWALGCLGGNPLEVYSLLR